MTAKLEPTFRTSQVSHYEFWEFGKIGLAIRRLAAALRYRKSNFHILCIKSDQVGCQNSVKTDCDSGGCGKWA